MVRVRHSTTPKKLNPEDVPEVQRFLEAEAALEAFKEKHRELYDQLLELSQERNTAHAAADKFLRQQEAACGPFELLRVDTKYNTQALYDQLGREDFVRFGGTIRTVEVYEIDKMALESYIAAGQVPDEIVEATQSRIPNYKKIPKVQLP